MSQSQINEVGLSNVVRISGRLDEPQARSGDPVVWGLRRSSWIQIVVVGALFCGLFWPNLRRLWDKTNPIYGEANWGHAIFIPFAGLYYLYVNREKLLRPDVNENRSAGQKGAILWGLLVVMLVLPLGLVRVELSQLFVPLAGVVGMALLVSLVMVFLRPFRPVVDIAERHSAGWFGGFVMLLGIAIFQYGIFPGQNDFVKDFGMVVTLFGVVLVLTGWGVMKTAWFPIAFLVCGLPWPGLFYSQVAGPLQRLAANVAVWTLQLTGVEASAGGTKISMIGGNGQWRTLNVAEACAGMRSLMTFVSVAAAVAFLSHRPLWQKIIVVLFAVPIAISCNVMRVSGQGLLDRYVSHSLSENFAHQFVGLMMLIPAFLLILLVGWVLDQIFVEQIDRRFEAHAPKVISRAAPLPAAVIAPAAGPRRTLVELRTNDNGGSEVEETAAAEQAGEATPVAPAVAKPVMPAPAAKLAPPAAGVTTPPARVTPPPPARVAPPPPVRTAPAPARVAPPAAKINPGRVSGSKPGAGMGSIVPPPPSVRLAPRSGMPRRKPGESKPGENKPGENKPTNPSEGK